MAFFRSWFSSLLPLSVGLAELALASGSLHAGQRLAKPGLPGLSSNSSEQITQTFIGNAIEIFFLSRFYPVSIRVRHSKYGRAFLTQDLWT